jgi:DNA-binding winged helix-turn-helix (wHTH) protein
VDGNRFERSPPHHGYAFGPFVVDAVRRRLWRESRPVPITSKTFDVLVVLLEHRDHVVSKDELLSRVWPSTVVNENNLARQISSLRRALGQRPDQHDFVVTIPGHGYRFVASVQSLTDVPSELHTDHETPFRVLPEPEANLEDPNISEASPSDPPVRAVSPPGSYQSSSTQLRGRWTRLGILVATGCGAVAIALALALLRPASPDPQPRRAVQRITYDEASLPREASWAPDGQWVVYATDRSGNADLWKHRLGDPDPIRLTNSEANESQPQWSPDGRSIAFRTERDGGGLYVIPAAGGVERIVSSFGYGPAWSPDGTQILFKRSAVLPDLPTIYRVGLDGKPPMAVRPDVLGQFTSLHPPGILMVVGSPSGERPAKARRDS